MSAPKRDKFAAMEAQQEQQSGPASPPAAAASIKAPRGGGKFAALQKSSAPKRDKFSALANQTAQSSSSSSLVTTTSKEEAAAAAKRQEWKTRCQQRDELWKQLEEAEVHVLELLQHAQKTCESLANQTQSEMLDPTEIQQLASKVPQCIQGIHDKLAPAAKFVQAYKAPERINRVYQARVEEGLALQREQVLESLVALEKSDEPGEKKRKREE